MVGVFILLHFIVAIIAIVILLSKDAYNRGFHHGRLHGFDEHKQITDEFLHDFPGYTALPKEPKEDES